MPLIKRKSPKAFEHNLKAEMSAGKPQPQALAVAYSVKRKAKKASGGTVESGSKDMNYADGGSVTAKTEKRPMPDQTANDAKTVGKNSGNKPPKDDSWTSKPTERQAQDNNGRRVLPIKHPKMVPQSTYSTRIRGEEDDLQRSAGVNEGPQRQPPEHDNEEDADSSGHSVRDMADEYSTHRKPYAKGGEVEESDYDHPLDGKYEDDLTDLPPSEDEGLAMADSDDEEGQDRQGPAVPDMEDEHSNGRKPYAEGGMTEADSVDEEEVAHAASIAAAVMAKMRAEGRLDSGSEDEEDAVEDHSALGKSDGIFTFPRKKLARGGKILSEDSMESTDDDQADLSRNAEEDANMEDKASFDSLRKENYSESEGLKQLDSHRDSNLKGDSRESAEENDHDDDMVKAILKKMKSRSPMTR